MFSVHLEQIKAHLKEIKAGNNIEQHFGQLFDTAIFWLRRSSIFAPLAASIQRQRLSFDQGKKRSVDGVERQEVDLRSNTKSAKGSGTIRKRSDGRWEARYTIKAILKFILFSGVRESEAIGSTWDCIDFERGSIRIDHQLLKRSKSEGGYTFASLKNDKERLLAPPPILMKQDSADRMETYIQNTVYGKKIENR